MRVLRAHGKAKLSGAIRTDKGNVAMTPDALVAQAEIKIASWRRHLESRKDAQSVEIYEQLISALRSQQEEIVLLKFQTEKR